MVADNGYHSESNMEYLFSANIDSYVADKRFRKRDASFITQDRYKDLPTYYCPSRSSGKRLFRPEKMKQKIDTAVDWTLYGMRLAVGERPFAHIRSTIGLDGFNLGGKKVNVQWNLFCLVSHNLKRSIPSVTDLPRRLSENAFLPNSSLFPEK